MALPNRMQSLTLGDCFNESLEGVAQPCTLCTFSSRCVGVCVCVCVVCMYVCVHE